MRRVIRILLACGAGAAIAFGWVAPAQAATADDVTITASLSDQGILTVTQTINVTALSGIESITEVIPRSMDRDGQRYAYDVTNIAVSADGAKLDPTTVMTRAGTELSFPTGSAAEYVVSYEVSGTTIATTDNKIEFNWRLLTGLSIDVTSVTGTVSLPTMAVNFSCSSGVPGALMNCTTYSGGIYGDMVMDFTQKPLLSGQVVQAEIVFSGGMIKVTEDKSPIWTLGRALSPGWTQIGIMAAVLLAGGLVLFGLWRRVRTAGYNGEPISVARFSTDAEHKDHVFEADPDIRPGLVGTLIDSRVDPADILATILDLAVRGHLLITEVQTSRYATPDWLLTRQDGPDDLKDYERQLLDVMTTSQIKVSDLSESVMPVIGGVQDAIYADVLASGWFSRLPSKKSPALAWAWGGVAVAALALAALVTFTTFGLVGLGLVGVAIVGLAVADHVTHVTPKGAAIYAGLQILERELDSHSEADIAVADRYNQISRILPYAVVLGGWDRWLKAMQASDIDEADDAEALPWYHALPGWQLSVDFPTTMDAFITVVTGELFTRA